MRQVPQPSYEYDINRIVAVYKRGISDILIELQRMDLTNMQRAQTLATLKNIAQILAAINFESAAWVNEVIPKVITDGIAGTLVTLGVVETMDEAYKIVKFNKANKALAEAVIADTQSDLLSVTQNVDRKVRAAVRQVASESMRANYAKGINGRKAISRDILTGLRDTLGQSVNTGIIDAAGRRWKPEVYVKMLVTTKTTQAHIESTTNEAVQRGAYYGQISSHGAKDACRNWEGRIVKLVPDAPGDYPTLEYARSNNEVFHPFCRHVISPLRNPEGVK